MPLVIYVGCLTTGVTFSQQASIIKVSSLRAELGGGGEFYKDKKIKTMVDMSLVHTMNSVRFLLMPSCQHKHR